MKPMIFGTEIHSPAMFTWTELDRTRGWGVQFLSLVQTSASNAEMEWHFEKADSIDW